MVANNTGSLPRNLAATLQDIETKRQLALQQKGNENNSLTADILELVVKSTQTTDEPSNFKKYLSRKYHYLLTFMLFKPACFFQFHHDLFFSYS